MCKGADYFCQFGTLAEHRKSVTKTGMSTGKVGIPVSIFSAAESIR